MILRQHRDLGDGPRAYDSENRWDVSETKHHYNNKVQKDGLRGHSD